MRTLRAVLRVNQKDGEAGVSLVEMVVTCALAALMVSLAGTFAVQVMDQTQDEVDRGDSTANARVAMEYVSRSLRTATLPCDTEYAFRLSSNGNDITFCGLVDTTVDQGQLADLPKKIQIQFVANTDPTLTKLQQLTFIATGRDADGRPTYHSTPDEVRLLVKGIVAPQGGLFTLQTTSDASTSVSDLTSVSQVNATRFVSINLQVQRKRPGATTRPASVSSIVRLPNLLA